MAGPSPSNEEWLGVALVEIIGGVILFLTAMWRGLLPSLMSSLRSVVSGRQTRPGGTDFQTGRLRDDGADACVSQVRGGSQLGKTDCVCETACQGERLRKKGVQEAESCRTEPEFKDSLCGLLKDDRPSTSSDSLFGPLGHNDYPNRLDQDAEAAPSSSLANGTIEPEPVDSMFGLLDQSDYEWAQGEVAEWDHRGKAATLSFLDDRTRGIRRRARRRIDFSEASDEVESRSVFRTLTASFSADDDPRALKAELLRARDKVVGLQKELDEEREASAAAAEASMNMIQRLKEGTFELQLKYSQMERKLEGDVGGAAEIESLHVLVLQQESVISGMAEELEQYRSAVQLMSRSADIDLSMMTELKLSGTLDESLMMTPTSVQEERMYSNETDRFVLPSSA